MFSFACLIKSGQCYELNGKYLILNDTYTNIKALEVLLNACRKFKAENYVKFCVRQALLPGPFSTKKSRKWAVLNKRKKTNFTLIRDKQFSDF